MRFKHVEIFNVEILRTIQICVLFETVHRDVRTREYPELKKKWRKKLLDITKQTSMSRISVNIFILLPSI